MKPDVQKYASVDVKECVRSDRRSDIRGRYRSGVWFEMRVDDGEVAQCRLMVIEVVWSTSLLRDTAQPSIRTTPPTTPARTAVAAPTTPPTFAAPFCKRGLPSGPVGCSSAGPVGTGSIYV